MSRFSRVTDFVLPLALVASLLVILVPLPTVMMDLLLAVNIAAAVLILLTTVFVRSPLEFNVFPTVLLAATLGRLVLNVATTRLILVNAPTQGELAAGGIIQGFGRFVAGDQIAVGLVIFLIIVLIQFLVVTKGATRMSEVAARFALDGMPGRQMAVDADLSAGLIDQVTAQQRREELNRHADFYGSMDGASKFVRGDAIAGLVITMINIVGGLFIGIVQSGMSFSEAASVFTKLTIGDGLVSQVPAFLVALAAGLLITRSTERSNLPNEFIRQLLSRPEPLIVAAVFLGLLTFTHLPAIPLLAVGGCLAALAYAIQKQGFVFEPDESDRAHVERAASAGGMQAAENGFAESVASGNASVNEARVEDLLTVDPIELEIGVGLLRLADPDRGGDLLEHISQLRRQFAIDMGMVLPRVRIRDNMGLGEYNYRIRLFSNAIAGGKTYPLRVLAVQPEGSEVQLDGILGEDPVSSQPAWWIDPTEAESAAVQSCTVRSASESLVAHLKSVVESHAPELLTRDATRKLVDQLREGSPALVDELIPAKLSLGGVQKVLKRLLREGVSIRNLPVILETLCDHATRSSSIERLTEEVRGQLARTLSAQFRDEQGEIKAVTLDSDWERRLRDLVATERTLSELPYGSAEPNVLAPDAQNELLHAVRSATRDFQRQNLRPVLLVASAVRQLVRESVESEFPNLPVLSYREICPNTRVQSVAVIGQSE